MFVVGKGKTGTTSLGATLRAMGYRVGDRRHADLRCHQYLRDGDVKPIIRYCRGYEAFEDAPFGLPGMAEQLDRAFPGSRFILSVRNSAEEWYGSVVRFHATIFRTGGGPPTADQLRSSTWVAPGYLHALILRSYGTTDDDPYERERLIEAYEAHNAKVREYFAGSNRFLEVNVAEPDALHRMETFLGRSSGLTAMPHENRTQ